MMSYTFIQQKEFITRVKQRIGCHTGSYKAKGYGVRLVCAHISVVIYEKLIAMCVTKECADNQMGIPLRYSKIVICPG